jgi:hypothetical protein
VVALGVSPCVGDGDILWRRGYVEGHVDELAADEAFRGLVLKDADQTD